MPHFTRSRRAQRGSLLIVALLLCAIIGVSLGSYLHLSRTALTISNRALYNNAAMNLAEQGVEEAMYSINQFINNANYTWPGWTVAGFNAYREWTDVALSQNAKAEYRVYIYNYLGVSAPKVVARARVQLGNGGAPIEKWLEVSLLRTSKFANGLVAKNSIAFNGNNASVDSWNSEWNTAVSPAVARTPPVPFSAGVRNDNGSVGSISIATDAVVVQNADIWGYVSNNSGSDLHPPEEFVGSNGSILGEDSISGIKVDPNRTSTTFSATLDNETAPTDLANANLGIIDIDGYVLPRATDLTPKGIAGVPEYADYFVYDATKIDLANKKLTINGKVLLRLSSTDASIAVSGLNGEIEITNTGYLSVYTPGNVAIAGKGVSNGVDGSDADLLVNNVSELGQPKKFQLWGTKDSPTQNISFAGTGLFSGIVYAPNGSVTIVGNGAVCGSIVAGDITLTGKAEFHYDESLATLGGDSPFRIAKWKELTSATERSGYATVINWGP